MRKSVMAAALGAAAFGTGVGAAPAPVVVDRNVLHVQVILDRLGFAPGVLDGRAGLSLTNALNGFQEANGLKVTGEADTATLRALYPHRAFRPTRTLRLDAAALAGPFTGAIPKEPEAQAKLPALGYRAPIEKLAEMFHTTPAVLVALNPSGRLAAGSVLTVPNALPGSRDYDAKLPQKWRDTLASLNVDARQPTGAKIVVDKSDGVLRVLDKDDKLVAQFTATMGSARDPLPIGNWTVRGVAYNPDWKMDPTILKGVPDDKPAVTVPPGPNSPVGVVWIDLSKEHYGIHGTNEPHQIGRAQSNGCIRLTNWDAARLALMVKGGTPAVFRP